MTKEEILEGNHLIYEFEIGKPRIFHEPGFSEVKVYGHPLWKDILVDSLQYHKLWDWLMPVVIKIRNGKFITRYQLKLQMELCNPDIEKIYKVVVDIIKWYNQTNNHD